MRAKLEQVKLNADLQFLKHDVAALIGESKEGISRMTKIVLDLKDFSRVGSEQEWQFTDLHAGIDSTLNIVGNETKYKAQVVKHYGQLPQIECLPSQLNQVFLNMLVLRRSDDDRRLSGCGLRLWQTTIDSVPDRQPHTECRALADFGFQVDAPIVLLDDPIG